MSGIILPHETTGITLDYTLINPIDRSLIAAIADRAIGWVHDYRKADPKDQRLEPSWQIMAMDISTVHMVRGLKLREFLNAPIEQFLNEIVQIGMFIDRPCATFPIAVALRYADPGVIPKPPH